MAETLSFYFILFHGFSLFSSSVPSLSVGVSSRRPSSSLSFPSVFVLSCPVLSLSVLDRPCPSGPVPPVDVPPPSDRRTDEKDRPGWGRSCRTVRAGRTGRRP